MYFRFTQEKKNVYTLEMLVARTQETYFSTWDMFNVTYKEYVKCPVLQTLRLRT